VAGERGGAHRTRGCAPYYVFIFLKRRRRRIKANDRAHLSASSAEKGIAAAVRVLHLSSEREKVWPMVLKIRPWVEIMLQLSSPPCRTRFCRLSANSFFNYSFSFNDDGASFRSGALNFSLDNDTRR
jgi:hypothetical protein